MTITTQPSTPNLQPGDLYLVKFHPATGAELKKYRPAVVISSIHPDIKENLAIICPLSSSLSPSATYEVVTHNSALNQTSAILCWYLRTVDTTRLVKKLGTLNQAELNKVRTKIAEVLALNSSY